MTEPRLYSHFLNIIGICSNQKADDLLVGSNHQPSQDVISSS